MLQSITQTDVAFVPSFFAAFEPLRVPSARWTMQAEPLARGAEAEVVRFLSERPVHAVNLLGLIADNGLVSPHNRGTFYACRDEAGRLEGVALIGHATLFEARTPRALRAFARAAQTRPNLQMVLGESAPGAGAGPAASFCSGWTARTCRAAARRSRAYASPCAKTFRSLCPRRRAC